MDTATSFNFEVPRVSHAVWDRFACPGREETPHGKTPGLGWHRVRTQHHRRAVVDMTSLYRHFMYYAESARSFALAWILRGMRRIPGMEQTRPRVVGVGSTETSLLQQNWSFAGHDD